MTLESIQEWIRGPYDEATKQEIQRLEKENPKELRDAFFKRLEFGTGGLRGVMGPGTNRMNVYTVKAATQGLANYLLATNKQPSVLVGYDSRQNSRLFAEETAKVLAANGIQVFLFDALTPVAYISFGTIYLGATAGVLITASHNPPEYNGYKVYWSYGGQILPPHDQGIIREVNQITSPHQVKSATLPHPLVKAVGDEIAIAFRNAIFPLQLHPEENSLKGNELHIVYTSLHGVGINVVPPALQSWGFSQLTLVESQAMPDGRFPTVKGPNPEDPEALALGIKMLEDIRGDILLATDPDVDRLGVVVLHEGKSVLLTGNQVASLACEYVLSSLRHLHRMPLHPICVKTIVTTELFAAIAHFYDVPCQDVLTGFKYIGGKMDEWESAVPPAPQFIFGGEESFGYLLGTQTKDKDAIVSACLIAEMALYFKERRKTLVDALESLYQKYGVYREKLLSLTFPGEEGLRKITTLMKSLRETPPVTFGQTPIIYVEDYLNRLAYDPTTTRHFKPTGLPASDAIRLTLEDQTKIVIRPSGTEPKVKMYISSCCNRLIENRVEMESAIQRVDSLLGSHLKTAVALFQIVA